jgi:hypothetical protein
MLTMLSSDLVDFSINTTLFSFIPLHLMVLGMAETGDEGLQGALFIRIRCISFGVLHYGMLR